jgi:hypothetical protein
MQLVVALSVVALLSGCGGGSDQGGDKGVDWNAKENLQNIAAEYQGYISNYNKPPASLEDFMKRWGSEGSAVKGIKDGRYIVIWNAEPGKQDASANYYILAYQAKPGPSGKRWVGRVKQVGPSWDSADPVELTEEEFQKAPKVKPNP